MLQECELYSHRNWAQSQLLPLPWANNLSVAHWPHDSNGGNGAISWNSERSEWDGVTAGIVSGTKKCSANVGDDPQKLMMIINVDNDIQHPCDCTSYIWLTYFHITPYPVHSGFKIFWTWPLNESNMRAEMLTDAQCQWFMEDALGKLRPELSFMVKKGRQGFLCPPKVSRGMLQKCT